MTCKFNINELDELVYEMEQSFRDAKDPDGYIFANEKETEVKEYLMEHEGEWDLDDIDEDKYSPATIELIVKLYHHGWS